MSLKTLTDEYAAGPALLRKAVAGMSREQVLARPIAGKWSTLEVVAHLSDFEVVYVDRLTAIIAEHEPTLPGRDEKHYAARLAYQAARPGRRTTADGGLPLLRTARILRTLGDADLARVGRHTEAGPLTLAQMLERIIQHVHHHVQFIHEKRQALGLPQA